MGKFVLIALIAFIFNLSISNLQFNKTLSNAADNVTEYYEHNMVRNLTEATLNYYIYKVSDNILLSKNYLGTVIENARYFSEGIDTVTIADSSDGQIHIKVAGRYGNATHTAEAMLLQLGGLPEMMEYAILSEGDVDLRGSVSIEDDNNGLNTNVHTNGSLTVRGSRASAQGFGSASGLILGSPIWAPFNAFSPNDNPINLPPVKYKPPVTIEPFEIDSFITIADINHSGDLTLNGATLGTKDNPVIYRVDGNLDLRGTIQGYGAFIVSGDVFVNGDITSSGTSGTESPLAIYSENDVIMRGGTTVVGQIFAENNVQFNGNVTLHGNVVANGRVDFRGNVTLRYRPANQILTKPFWDTNTGGGIMLTSLYN